MSNSQLRFHSTFTLYIQEILFQRCFENVSFCAMFLYTNLVDFHV